MSRLVGNGTQTLKSLSPLFQPHYGGSCTRGRGRLWWTCPPISAGPSRNKLCQILQSMSLPPLWWHRKGESWDQEQRQLIKTKNVIKTGWLKGTGEVLWSTKHLWSFKVKESYSILLNNWSSWRLDLKPSFTDLKGIRLFSCIPSELIRGHVIVSGLSGVGWMSSCRFLLFRDSFVSACRGRGDSSAPPPPGCTLGCQEKLREEKDRWLLALKSVLGDSRRRRGASAVLLESQEADALTYAFPSNYTGDEEGHGADSPDPRGRTSMVCVCRWYQRWGGLHKYTPVLPQFNLVRNKNALILIQVIFDPHMEV